MLKKLLPLFALLFLISCSNKPAADLNSFSWLAGKWEGDYSGMQTFEEWQPAKDNAMLGQGGIVSDNDTMFKEKIRIDLRDGELFYVATVPGNPGPVDFKYTGIVNDSIMFENPEHDFPQRVLYVKKGPDAMYARVDGKQGKRYRKEEFNFKRAK